MNCHGDGDGKGSEGEQRSAGWERGRERGRVWRPVDEYMMGTGTGTGNRDGSEDSSGDGNGNEDNGNGHEDGIREGGREAKESKKPQNSCRRHVGNGGDLGGKRKICTKERVDQVAANTDNLECNKEAGGEAKCTQGLSKNCTSRESVSPLLRLIRGFRNKYH